MEIILLERVEKLGLMGDKVTVKPGFARNYLLPKKIALRATKENIAYFETQKKHLEADNLKHCKEAEKIGEKMQKVELIMIRQAGESDQLYGSVSANDIAKSLGKQGFTVNRSQVVLDHPIKMLGLYKARVNLHPEVSIEVGLNIAKSEEEAVTQRETAIAEAAVAKQEAAAEKKAKAESKAKAAEEKADTKKETSEEKPAAKKKAVKKEASEKAPESKKTTAKKEASEEKPVAKKKAAKKEESAETPKAEK